MDAAEFGGGGLTITKFIASVCVASLFGLVACNGNASSFVPTSGSGSNATPRGATPFVALQGALPTPIEHVVIIDQENRTPDYLFQGIPGADIAKTAIDSHGNTVQLQEVSLGAPYDLDHSHKAFVKDYNDGKMDGFDRGMSPKKHLRPFGYAPESEVKPYHDMAKQYAFADHMFESNQGPSFPSHLYIVSGTATDKQISDDRVAENPRDSVTGKLRGGGCDAPDTTLVRTIVLVSGVPGPRVHPCFDRPVLSDFLDQKSVSWRYYEDFLGAGLWHPFDAIYHVRYGKDYANVMSPPESILTDISQGRLAGVTWVTPDGAHSDHAGQHGNTGGPSWVAAIVNAIGHSQYWKTTAIFVTWDDWGGWYDHVPPQMLNHYELGFRVPLVVISPYAKHGYVSKVPHEFGSILAFTEETFGIPKGALQATDERADDLKDAFNFGQKPRRFVTIKAPPFHPSTSTSIGDEDP
ncbi:MAG: hypothetical protein JOY69_01720 [Candidatus Eremiobacteraeota bacterium]|nr:hypothetical protein [Candidatus Eremiobacteraeota bacterium]